MLVLGVMIRTGQGDQNQGPMIQQYLMGREQEFVLSIQTKFVQELLSVAEL